jgi:hypothetical protein
MRTFDQLPLVVSSQVVLFFQADKEPRGLGVFQYLFNLIIPWTEGLLLGYLRTDMNRLAAGRPRWAAAAYADRTRM